VETQSPKDKSATKQRFVGILVILLAQKSSEDAGIQLSKTIPHQEKQ
jgi:hypothetical protein